MGGVVDGGAMKLEDFVTGSWVGLRVSRVEALLVPWRLVSNHFRATKGERRSTLLPAAAVALDGVKLVLLVWVGFGSG